MIRINKITQFIIIFMLSSMPIRVIAQDGNTWTRLENFGGLQRERAVAFAINDYGYVCTGLDTAEQTKKDLWRYDPELDTWSQMADLPGEQRKDAVAFTVEGKGFVGTGFSHDDSEIGTYLADMWRYNPEINTWDSIAPYPGGDGLGVSRAAAFSALDKGYIVCGKIGSNNYLSDLWEYDPVDDDWTIRFPFPGGNRYQLIAMGLLDKGYVGLGTDHDIHRKDFWMYDPLTGLWTAMSDFAGTERALSSTFSINNMGFVVFGLDGGYKDELWEYNPYFDSWNIKAPFPGGGRKNGVAFSIHNIGYAGIGKEIDGKKRSFYAYYPNLPLSIKETEKDILKIYPNPSSDHINIDLSAPLSNYSYSVVDINGCSVRPRTIIDQQKIDLRDFKVGTYFLLLFNSNNQIIDKQKFIKINE